MLRLVLCLVLVTVTVWATDGPKVSHHRLFNLLSNRLDQLQKRVETQDRTIARLREENQKIKLPKSVRKGIPMHTGDPVGFHVTKTDDYLDIGEDEAVPFEQVKINLGDGWNATANQFVAPVAGVYTFFVSTYARPGTASHLWLRHNTEDVQFVDAAGGHNNAGGTMILNLAVNDRVDCQTRATYIVRGGDRSHFSGFLLHPTAANTTRTL